MTVLQSLKRRLSASGIYRVNAANLQNELKTYADGIGELYTLLDGMLSERFIATATGDGLTEYEEMFGPPRGDLSVAERRERLKKRMSLNDGDFTPAGIRKALDSFGLEYVISEFPAQNRLEITAQTRYSQAERAFISRETAKIVPAHLEFQLVFNTLMWSELDARDKTFAELDNDDLRWEEIDSLT